MNTHILKPRVSEKAAFLKAGNCYAFDISMNTNKRQVAEAVKSEYKKTPTHVRVVVLPHKKIFARGKWGTRGGGKKAYVFMQKGETLEV